MGAGLRVSGSRDGVGAGSDCAGANSTVSVFSSGNCGRRPGRNRSANACSKTDTTNATTRGRSWYHGCSEPFWKKGSMAVVAVDTMCNGWSVHGMDCAHGYRFIFGSLPG